MNNTEESIATTPDIKEEFQLSSYDEIDYKNNAHVMSLKSATKLESKHHKLAKRAYSANKELGLFKLFCANDLFQALHKWTNDYCAANGKKKISLNSLELLVGLEIAASIRPNASTKEC